MPDLDQVGPSTPGDYIPYQSPIVRVSVPFTCPGRVRRTPDLTHRDLTTGWERIAPNVQIP